MRHRTSFNPNSRTELGEFCAFYHAIELQTSEQERREFEATRTFNTHLKWAAANYLAPKHVPTIEDLVELHGYLLDLDAAVDTMTGDDDVVGKLATDMFEVMIGMESAVRLRAREVLVDSLGGEEIVELPTGVALAEAIARGDLFAVVNATDDGWPYFLYAQSAERLFIATLDLSNSTEG